LNYRPNAIARTLISGRSKIVCVVMADVTNPFYVRVLAVLSRLLQERGLTLLLISAADSHSIDAFVPTLLAYHVDGVVIASATLSSSLARECASAGLPAVLVNRYTEDAPVSAVACDNEEGGRQVAQLLVRTGHRRIAYMAGLEDTSSNRDRERGFTTSLGKDGLTLAGRAVGSYTYEGGRRAAAELLGGSVGPDAIFCANDQMALGMIDAARAQFGLDVPKDISVAGFDNIPAAELDAYSLTSVEQDVEQMAAQALSMLLDEDAQAGTRLVTVPCRLVVRQSVKQGLV
jgi:DNA-binding LacI/PurR family transcriptional regulator